MAGGDPELKAGRLLGERQREFQTEGPAVLLTCRQLLKHSLFLLSKKPVRKPQCENTARDKEVF